MGSRRNESWDDFLQGMEPDSLEDVRFAAMACEAQNARLREKLKALKRNRWAGATDEELEDMIDGVINHETLSEIEAELARREGSDEQ